MFAARSVVAADVGAMGSLLSRAPGCLYRVGDAQDLADKLIAQLETPTAIDIKIEGWAGVIGKLEPRAPVVGWRVNRRLATFRRH